MEAGPPTSPCAGGGMRLVAGRFDYRFPGPALVMGIVNVTPDSFSGGGI